MVVDVDGLAEKHGTSQLIKSIYLDALHCDMAQQPLDLLLKTVKIHCQDSMAAVPARNQVTTCPCHPRPSSARSSAVSC